MRRFVILSLGVLFASSAFAAGVASAHEEESCGITAKVTTEGGMRVYAAAKGDETIKRPPFMLRSVGSAFGKALLGDDLVAAAKVKDNLLLRMDDDALDWVTIRLKAAKDGFLGGSVRTIDQMLGQYRNWLQRRITGDWGHGLFGFTPDGEIRGWVLAGGYDEKTIKVKKGTGEYADASGTDMYREAFKSQPYRKEFAGWLAPDCREKGFGSWALYAYIYVILPKVDAGLTTEIILTVSPDNVIGVGLLRKLGFDQVEGEFYREGKPDEYLPRRVFRLQARDIPAKKAAVTEGMCRKR